MGFDSLNVEQKKMLYRVSQQGMEDAAAMLSQLLGYSVALQLADTWTADSVPSQKETNQAGVGINMSISGQLTGNLLMFLPEHSAFNLSRKLLRTDDITDLQQEPACSTLKEVGNILASAFLSSLDKQLGIRAFPSPPEMINASLAVQMLYLRQQVPGSCLVIESCLVGAQDQENILQGSIYMFPSQESLQHLLEKISVEND